MTKPIILGSNPEALWPMLHEVSGVSRVHFRRHFEFCEMDDFTPPPVGATMVVVERGFLTLFHEVLGGVNWYLAPPPEDDWYDEPAHRLAVGLLLEELLCR